jgi:hypothetical protein
VRVDAQADISTHVLHPEVVLHPEIVLISMVVYQGDYSDLLSRSKYCLVAPGDGWSGRAEDAVLHGCVPVVIMDGVHVVFESVLDWPSFSVRIAVGESVTGPSMINLDPALNNCHKCHPFAGGRH